MAITYQEAVPRIPDAPSPEHWSRPRIEVNDDAVELTGTWTLSALHLAAASLRRELASLSNPQRHWDLHGVTALDEFGALLLWREWNWRLPSSVLLRPEHEARFATLPPNASVPRLRPRMQPLDVL